MMTISESNYSSNKMSTIHTLNDKVIHKDSFNDVQQSSSTNSALITKRGFKPSDMFDPQKKEFLTNLSYKLFPNDHPKDRDGSPTAYMTEFADEGYSEVRRKQMEEFGDSRSPLTVGDKEIDLNKIFTPAPDAEDNIIKKNKSAFASSAFYATGLHPTVKDQIELAKKISTSLSEPANQMSRGQSMYTNRKKRSVKWVHEGKGRNTSNTCATPTPSSNHDTLYRPPNSTVPKKNYPPQKYTTYPRTNSGPSVPPLRPTNTLPKMEPFPSISPIETQHTLLLSPLPQTNLNNTCSPLMDSTRQNLWGGKNYNTAARGWGEVKDYYRPITFDDIGTHNAVPFSDF